ncbi:50S ribosomal protein L7/L12 [Acetobacterium sp.]|uniref:50S ribosomal protein L7/L12 n=1 Tax=Acetobacterium sp. TaxID=1872094 RepID=UPI002721D01E|nr:50S ribosomal protein L7/L12 [Acetobacterium sp.]MDO9493131.1 50S ribosomal protein L7/L12 [Acetobacterium sp.]
MASEKVTQLIEDVKGLTVLELSELVKALEEEFGVSAAAPMAMMAAPAAGGAAEEAEEQTEFDVILTAAGDQKIKVIKVVRELTGLGLKEAKALVDEAPKPVKEAATKEEAADIKAKIEEVGGSVEVK